MFVGNTNMSDLNFEKDRILQPINTREEFQQITLRCKTCPILLLRASGHDCTYST